jgi:DNA transformation protein
MSSDQLDDFLIESVEAAIGAVKTRPMFGGVGIWKGGTFVAMVWDGALSVRLDEADEADHLDQGFTPVDPSSAGRGRKRYYEVPADVLEDPSELKVWLDQSIDVARSDG